MAFGQEDWADISRAKTALAPLSLSLLGDKGPGVRGSSCSIRSSIAFLIRHRTPVRSRKTWYPGLFEQAGEANRSQFDFAETAGRCDPPKQVARQFLL